jgi:arsenate reductase (thioredoxin)
LLSSSPTPLRVLFVCVHNAGRSQMAEAIANARARERGLPVVAESAGTVGAGSLNPLAVEALREIGVPTEGLAPKLLTPTMTARAHRIVSMGCGVDADACPTRFLVTEDWGLDDPAGRPLEQVRRIRDEIAGRVDAMLEDLR